MCFYWLVYKQEQCPFEADDGVNDDLKKELLETKVED
jgi:hypothetical protein